jgi:formate/nitrite transporter FocA (FNT family)
MRNGGWAYLGNLVGAVMAQIARNKIALDSVLALARGVLCNVLVCLAVGCAWERGV